jgi:hypothetical protein
LNLISEESFERGYSRNPRDLLETNLIFFGSEKSTELYSEALDLFQKGGLRRGCAAILLRQGCVEHMLAVAKTTKVETQRMKGLGIAKGKLKDALDLFALDEVHTKITEGHLILVKIGVGKNDDVIYISNRQPKLANGGKRLRMSSCHDSLEL